MLEQGRQQVELAPGQLDRLPPDEAAALGAVELEAVAPQDALLRYEALRAAKLRPHTCHHLGRRERLHDVIVGAELEPCDAIRLLATGGHKDDRDRRLLTNPPHDLEAVDLRQHHVDEREVDSAPAEQRERIGAVLRLSDGEALLAQVEAEQAPQRPLVLDDQHLGRRAHAAIVANAYRATAAA